MNTDRHYSRLAAMDITVWQSRYVLPGAKNTLAVVSYSLHVISTNREVGCLTVATIDDAKTEALLDAMLAAIQLKRVLTDTSAPSVNARFILVMGVRAAQPWVQSSQPVEKLRAGKWQWGERQMPVFVTYHPATVKRQPHLKRAVWHDLKQVKHCFESDAHR